MSKRSATKIPILIKKSESKKGSLWNDFSHRRIIRQHGGDEIPEGDLHAVKKYESPIPEPTSTPKETEETLSYLEKEIEVLKKYEEKQKQQTSPSKPPGDFEEFFDDEPIERDNDRDDDL